MFCYIIRLNYRLFSRGVVCYMKRKLSISIEADKIDLIEEKVNNGVFRNKSHLIEFALDKFLQNNSIPAADNKCDKEEDIE